jgi:hypothetical protein
MLIKSLPGHSMTIHEGGKITVEMVGFKRKLKTKLKQ